METGRPSIESLWRHNANSGGLRCRRGRRKTRRSLYRQTSYIFALPCSAALRTAPRRSADESDNAPKNCQPSVMTESINIRYNYHALSRDRAASVRDTIQTSPPACRASDPVRFEAASAIAASSPAYCRSDSRSFGTSAPRHANNSRPCLRRPGRRVSVPPPSSADAALRTVHNSSIRCRVMETRAKRHKRRTYRQRLHGGRTPRHRSQNARAAAHSSHARLRCARAEQSFSSFAKDAENSLPPLTHHHKKRRLGTGGVFSCVARWAAAAADRRDSATAAGLAFLMAATIVREIGRIVRACASGVGMTRIPCAARRVGKAGLSGAKKGDTAAVYQSNSDLRRASRPAHPFAGCAAPASARESRNSCLRQSGIQSFPD